MNMLNTGYNPFEVHGIADKVTWLPEINAYLVNDMIIPDYCNVIRYAKGNCEEFLITKNVAPETLVFSGYPGIYVKTPKLPGSYDLYELAWKKSNTHCGWGWKKHEEVTVQK